MRVIVRAEAALGRDRVDLVQRSGERVIVRLPRPVEASRAAAYDQVVSEWHAEGPMPVHGRKGRRAKKWSA